MTWLHPLARPSRGVPALLCVSLLLGCSGGGGGGGDDFPFVDLASEAALDGLAQSDGPTNTSGGGPLVGDYEIAFPGVSFRQFFSFALDAIPPGAVIESVVLRLHQEDIDGLPYDSLGVLTVDHMDYGVTLDFGEYALPALTVDIGTLSSDDNLEIKTLDVTAAVLADLAASRTRSQFRVQFDAPNDGDGLADFVSLTDAENSHSSSGTLPVLRVSYSTP